MIFKGGRHEKADLKDKKTQGVAESQVNVSQRGSRGGGLRGRGRVDAGMGFRGTRNLKSAFEPVEDIQLLSSSAHR